MPGHLQCVLFVVPPDDAKTSGRTPTHETSKGQDLPEADVFLVNRRVYGGIGYVTLQDEETATDDPDTQDSGF